MRTTRLTDLYRHDGPFASVTLDVSHATESGAHEHELRVRDVCQTLIDAGAEGRAVEAVSNRLREELDEASPVARTIVATADGVVFDATIHGAVETPRASWGPLPDVAAWIEHQDAATPFVLALVDHVGGDVAVYTSDVPEPEETSTAGGETTHVHKVPTGGWSALRYQRETENVWKENARDVTEEILSAVRTGPDLVLLAGDPRSRAMVAEGLGDAPAEVVQLTSGGRAEDGGDEALQEAIRQALLDHTVARRLELTHTLQDRLGSDTAVATGVSDVAEAFVRGQVETLLLDPAAAGDLSLTPQDFPGLMVGPAPQQAELPADQALVAAATLTGAQVSVGSTATFLGAPVAALLRWDQTAEGASA
jgi:hypothetical protein